MIKSLQEIIRYLFKYSSDILLVCTNKELIGFVPSIEIISLNNLNQSDISYLKNCLNYEGLKNLDLNKYEQKVYPVFNLEENTIDIISAAELKYLIEEKPPILKDIHYEAILKNISLPLVISNRFGKIIFANWSFLNLLSIEENDIKGLELDVFINRKEVENRNVITVREKKFNIVVNSIIAFDMKVNISILIPI